MAIDVGAKNSSEYTYSSDPSGTRKEMNYLAYKFSFIE